MFAQVLNAVGRRNRFDFEAQPRFIFLYSQRDLCRVGCSIKNWLLFLRHRCARSAPASPPRSQCRFPESRDRFLLKE